jgi:TDG/mug DNA glycosylase family protein
MILPNQDILQDVLQPNLKLVICGTAVAEHSAKLGSYYAGENNMFWRILYEAGLTDRLLHTSEYLELLNFGIGLTDIAKKASGVDAKISHDDYDLSAFYKKMLSFTPKIICFNGKASASLFFSWKYHHKCKTSQISYGLYPKKENEFSIFVCPSTSGAAKKYWEPRYWHELSKLTAGYN